VLRRLNASDMFVDNADYRFNQCPGHYINIQEDNLQIFHSFSALSYDGTCKQNFIYMFFKEVSGFPVLYLC
jgi:hypothetical protein